jgi:hypothetical protein
MGKRAGQAVGFRGSGATLSPASSTVCQNANQAGDISKPRSKGNKLVATGIQIAAVIFR